MKINDELELTVEKLVYEGSALAKYDGMPVFIDGGCPGDLLKAEVVKLNKNYAKAKIKEI